MPNNYKYPFVEKELLTRISGGDEKAFRHLVNLYSDLLGIYIFKLTHSRETAEEVVQDVFLKIWTARDTLLQVNNFHTWLYVISKNHALNALRKIIRERANNEILIRNISSLQEEENDWQDEKLSLIEKAIAHLPPQQRKAYILSRREGFSYKEIAEKMHISPETVKKYLQYATHSITEEMESLVKIGLLLLIIKNF